MPSHQEQQRSRQQQQLYRSKLVHQNNNKHKKNMNQVNTDSNQSDTQPAMISPRYAKIEEEELKYEESTFPLSRKETWYTSSYLRPGSKFHGHQESGQSVYDVQVTIKHVDMENAFLCGYLQIEGLTETHPLLITYFEGEMVSDKYSFYTQRVNWGANEEVDINHWSRFSSWRQNASKYKQENYIHKDFHNQRYIYMRWKEAFLVPDAHARNLQDASYAGFYYICFDQWDGSISGYYFHENWDKYQQLELTFSRDGSKQNTQVFEFR